VTERIGRQVRTCRIYIDNGALRPWARHFLFSSLPISESALLEIDLPRGHCRRLAFATGTTRAQLLDSYWLAAGSASATSPVLVGS
jgi:hypothetical protein